MIKASALAAFIVLIALGSQLPRKARSGGRDGNAGGATVTLRDLLSNPTKDQVFIPTPLIRQGRDFTCGAAALQSVLYYYGDDFREGTLQRLLKSDPKLGTSYVAMQKLVEGVLNDSEAREEAGSIQACDEDQDVAAEAFQRDCLRKPVIDREIPLFLERKPALHKSVWENDRYTVLVFRGREIEPSLKPLAPADGETEVPVDGLTVRELEAFLRDGKPVIVLVQAWPGSYSDPQWKDGNENGHYVVVSGYDGANFYLMDPSTAGTWAYVPRRDFVRRWHDEDTRVGPDGIEKKEVLRHFAMILYRKPHFHFLQAVPLME